MQWYRKFNKVHFVLHSFTFLLYTESFYHCKWKIHYYKIYAWHLKKNQKGKPRVFILSHLQEAGHGAQTETKIDEMWQLSHGRESEHKLREDTTTVTTQESKQLYVHY